MKLCNFIQCREDSTAWKFTTLSKSLSAVILFVGISLFSACDNDDDDDTGSIGQNTSSFYLLHEGIWGNNELTDGKYVDWIYPNGDKYTGTIVNGKKNGMGCITLANGNIYTGEWANDMFNGDGTLTYAPGQTYIKSVGTFKDGILMNGRIENSDGSIHEIKQENSADDIAIE